jgi:hypothetical protein
MTYEQIIESVSIIVENENIYKEGLTLVYELEATNHRKMNEQLFYKSNPPSATFISSDEFEVELGGIVVRLVKPKLDLED